MQAIAAKPLAAPNAGRVNVTHKNGWKFLLLFFAAAYGLAWLWFGVPILAARGLIASPAPDAVFLTLATLGVALAGIGAAALRRLLARNLAPELPDQRRHAMGLHRGQQRIETPRR